MGLVGVALLLLGCFLSCSFDFELELLEDLFDELDEEFGLSSLTSLVLLEDSFFLIGSPNKFLKVSLTGFLAFSFELSDEDFEADGVVVVLSRSWEDLDLLEDEW